MKLKKENHSTDQKLIIIKYSSNIITVTIKYYFVLEESCIWSLYAMSDIPVQLSSERIETLKLRRLIGNLKMQR